MTDAATTDTTTPPANAAEASAKLIALKGNPEWAAKWIGGNADAGREYKELSALVATGDPVARAMAGEADIGASGVIPDSKLKLMGDVAADLKEKGLSDGAVRQLLSDQKVTPEQYAAARQWKAEKLSDPEFVKSFLSGGAEAVKKMSLANIILVGGVEEKAQ